MELHQEFRVSVPVEQAWAVLTDLERVAPCMPGAELQEVEGDEYRGVVRVKVGPITTQYKGVARFLERDTENHTAVLRAEGRETRGQGNAAATITAKLTESGDETLVTITTDLAITGKVAQFGRGVLSDISEKLLNQFVAELEKNVLAAQPAADGEGEADAANPTESSASAPRSDPAGTAPVNLGAVAFKPLAKRFLILAPIVPIVGLIVLVARKFRGGFHRRSTS